MGGLRHEIVGILVVGVICIAAILGVPAVSAAPNPPHTNPIQHNPIVIEGDVGFTPTNGVVGGSGTADDPYLIAGWFINIDSWSATGITIRNTTAYVVIDRVDIYGGRFGSHGGVELTNVQHTRIANSTIQYSSFGVRAVSSTDVRISNCYLRANEQAVYVGLTNSAWIEWNGIDGEGLGIGVTIQASQGVVIGNNTLAQILSAVFVEESTNVLVQGNYIRRSGTSIELSDSTMVRVEGNTIVPLPQLALVPYRNMGFRLVVPQNWTLRENVGPDAVLRLYGPPLIDPAAIAVDTEIDFSIRETHETLSSFVRDDLRRVEGANPPGYLIGEPNFRSIANHSAVSFVIGYPSNNRVVKTVYIASDANGRWWRFTLTSQITNFAVEDGNFVVLDATFERMLATFEISAATINRLSPLSYEVLVPVGIALGAAIFAAALSLPVLRPRNQRNSRGPLSRPR